MQQIFLNKISFSAPFFVLFTLLWLILVKNGYYFAQKFG